MATDEGLEALIGRLQAFLMDAPRRYLEPGGADAGLDEACRSSAAALDYAKLIASPAAAPALSDGDAAASLHCILDRAVADALGIVRRAVDGTPARFLDFVMRWTGDDGILATLGRLHDAHRINDEAAFAIITASSDVAAVRSARAL